MAFRTIIEPFRIKSVERLRFIDDEARAGALEAGLTVLAPIAWGTTYIVITEVLPGNRPLFLATMRVAPAALVLLAAGALVSPWRPRGAEWWRTGALGLFNFGLFFPLLVAAAYRLPGGVAAAAGGLQPLLVAALTWLIAGQRPRALHLAVGAVAALGVALVVIRPGAGLDPAGVLAAVAANVSFATGVVLTKRFPTPTNRLAATGWQLLLGAVLLVAVTALVEGAPPPVSARNVAGFAYLSLVATGLAFVVWFAGIRRLPTSAPPLLGLAAPVTGAAFRVDVGGDGSGDLPTADYYRQLLRPVYRREAPHVHYQLTAEVTPARGLERDARYRYGSAPELLEDLRAFARDGRSGPRPLPFAKRAGRAARQVTGLARHRLALPAVCAAGTLAALARLDGVVPVSALALGGRDLELGLAPTGRWFVNLGDYGSARQAASAWRQLRSRHGDVLGELSRLAGVQDGGQPLLVGPLADAERAQSVCGTLRGRGQSCSALAL